MRKAHCPPADEGVLAQSSFFVPGRTFAVYVAHPEKRFPSHVAAFSRAGRRALSPRPALTTHHLFQKIARRGFQYDLALIALMSWAFFLLRVRAECLSVAGQEACGHVLNDDRLPRKAAIGRRQEKLVHKLNRRKRMVPGATIPGDHIRGKYLGGVA